MVDRQVPPEKENPFSSTKKPSVAPIAHLAEMLFFLVSQQRLGKGRGFFGKTLGTRGTRRRKEDQR